MTNRPRTAGRIPCLAESLQIGPGTGVMIWRLGPRVQCLSSAAVGGGLETPQWVMNIGVPKDYDRTDLHAHANELASHYELLGDGVGLFTAANLANAAHQTVTVDDHQISVDATVGVSHPTWAAQINPPPVTSRTHPHIGTINIVIQMPLPLDPGAAVNLVMTSTEAKTQALLDAGIPGTGTASDAVAVIWPIGPITIGFGGPRSYWGAATANGVYEAVRCGLTHHDPVSSEAKP